MILPFIWNFYPNNIKKLLTDYIGYVTTKEYEKNYSVNTLHLIFRNVNEYLILALTN